MGNAVESNSIGDAFGTAFGINPWILSVSLSQQFLCLCLSEVFKNCFFDRKNRSDYGRILHC